MLNHLEAVVLIIANFKLVLGKRCHSSSDNEQKFVELSMAVFAGTTSRAINCRIKTSELNGHG